ncbi:MAG: helix-turn-helix domain-containing protein [Baekduia sp.]
MSVNVMVAVLEGRLPVEITSARDTLVLIVLADHAGPDGSGAWPSIDTIARKSRMSRRTVWTALRSLKDAGAIVEERKQIRGVQSWRIVLDDAELAYKELPEDGATKSAHKAAAHSEGQVGNRRAVGDADCLQTVPRTVQETPTPGGEGGEGRAAARPSSPVVAEAHAVLTSLAAEHRVAAPTLDGVRRLVAQYPDRDHVEEAHVTARAARHTTLRAILGFHEHRLRKDPPAERDVRYDREAFLALERQNRAAREQRLAAHFDATEVAP